MVHSRWLLIVILVAMSSTAGTQTREERNACLADAEKLYKEAAACKPADAMERLDVELAKSEID